MDINMLREIQVFTEEAHEPEKPRFLRIMASIINNSKLTVHRSMRIYEWFNTAQPIHYQGCQGGCQVLLYLNFICKDRKRFEWGEYRVENIS